ncbi:MAG: aromatic amino acid lyase, partial [Candidatus Cloacimonetes bacterium]|nr:aromatic amino acid lyase [Candidatus Cloacimonadota bacterium]
GKAEYHGEILPGEVALRKVGLNPIKLKAKEGLALNNGTQVMTGIAVLAHHRALNLCRIADICAALSCDALLATPDAFDPLIHQVRPHPGQSTSARNISMLLDNSELRKSHVSCDNVQDAYSLRCSPQVNGAVRDALEYVRNTLEIEINSATDNPLIFLEEQRVISGGNFHGEPIAFASDTMGLTVSELGNISDRRCEHLLNPALNRGLKPFLAPRPGLDSGYMIAQLTAASLISENKILAHPASVDSIPTSANQEDHVSMGTIAAVKARKIIDNTAYVLAIEMMIAAQALDIRTIKSSPVLEAVRTKIREFVPTLEKDREINPDIEQLKKLVDSDLFPEITRQYTDLK